MKRLGFMVALASATGIFPCMDAAFAQAPQAAAPAAQGPVWTSRCISDGRKTPMTCIADIQGVPLSPGAQQVIGMSIRIEGGKTIVQVQTPSGISIPAGVAIQREGGARLPAPMIFCDQRGCFASLEAPADLVQAIKASAKMNVTFEAFAAGLGGAKFNVAVPPANLGPAYERIQ